jgi:hypothetical protein
MGNQTRGSLPVGGGDSIGGVVGLAVFGGAAWLVWSIFAVSIALGIGTIAFVALCVYLLVQLDKLKPLEKGVAAVALVLAALGALLLDQLAIENHVLPFAAMGWAIVGLFYVALVAGAWVAASAIGRVLAMLAGATTVAAMLVLPAPAGSADANDKDSEWSIELTVLDQGRAPLKGAVAQCSAVMVWDADATQPVTFDLHFAQETDDEGRAKFVFHEDPRLKVAMCTALKENEDGPTYMQPSEHEFSAALYPPKSVVMASPLPGREYKLDLELQRRAQSGGE